MMAAETQPPRVAVYCAHLNGGGVEQVALAQIDMLRARGYAVDLVLNHLGGHYAERVPAGVRVVPLEPADTASVTHYRDRALRGHPLMRMRVRFISANRLVDLAYLPALARYLEHDRPALVIANVWNMVLVAACAQACVREAPRLVGVFHSTFFAEAIQRRSARKHPLQWRHFFAFCRHFYSRAAALVTVSDGVGRDLVRIVGVPTEKVETLHNPVVSPVLHERARQPVEHAWLAPGAPPVIVAVGRLSPEKNYPLLLAAMARLHAVRPEVRLAILGEGAERAQLEGLRDQLGLNEHIILPGWVDNPHAWMRRAALVVLSSNWEGLPTVLIEALACGCPVVATDCLHGPREILEDGRYGKLVPRNDPEALSAALVDTLDTPRQASRLASYAERFSVDASTRRYYALVDRVMRLPR